MCRKDCPFRYKSIYGLNICIIYTDYFAKPNFCFRISDSLCQYIRFQYSQFFSSVDNKDNDSSETN